MTVPRRVLVVQTAFVGDVILVLPLCQILHERFPGTDITAVISASIVWVCLPTSAECRILSPSA
jgi:ADP-heptose:LPS heptosyltransferase